MIVLKVKHDTGLYFAMKLVNFIAKFILRASLSCRKLWWGLSRYSVQKRYLVSYHSYIDIVLLLYGIVLPGRERKSFSLCLGGQVSVRHVCDSRCFSISAFFRIAHICGIRSSKESFSTCAFILWLVGTSTFSWYHLPPPTHWANCLNKAVAFSVS